MEKDLKISLIVIGVLVGIILLDSIQALIFNNNPILGIETKCLKKEGILVNTYHCNGDNVTKIKLFNSSCESELVCDNYIKDKDKKLEKIIKENYEKIHKITNGLSSSTYDYINNDYYKNIVNLGENAVHVLINMTNNGDLVGLNAYIAAIAIQEITNCDIREKYELTWATPKEFFELWENNNCGFNK